MNVLIACEESQRVCTAFREKGHNAFSCDILEQSGGHPEWHIKGDVVPLLNGDCEFTTQDGNQHTVKGKWDMIIAFPPCTRLCNSGQRWLYFGDEEYKKAKHKEQLYAVVFFMQFVGADCEKIAIENPNAIINPLGEWTGGINVDTGATNRKLGSDMGRAVTGGGLHGKDLSKADVSVNIYAFCKAQETGQEVNLSCAIGDEYIADFKYVKNGKVVVEDAKGIKTDVYMLKKKLFEYKYKDLTIIEI